MEDSRLIAIWIIFFVVVFVWAGCFTLFWRNRKLCSFSGSQEDDLERLTQEQRSNRRRARRVRHNYSRLEAMELYRRMGDPPPSYEDSILASTATATAAPAVSQCQADGTQQPPDYSPVK